MVSGGKAVYITLHYITRQGTGGHSLKGVVHGMQAIQSSDFFTIVKVAV